MDEGNISDDAENAGSSKNKHGKPRTRVSRACDRCRSKKDKCDGKRPKCTACAAGNHVCIYDPSTKKRGLPEGYVRGIEKLWALAIGKVAGLEDAVSTLLDDKEQLLGFWNHDTLGEDLHERWKTSRVLRGLEDLLTNLESGGSASVTTKAKSQSPADGSTPFHRVETYRVIPGAESQKGIDVSHTAQNGLHRLSAAADMLLASAPQNDELTLPPRKRQRIEEDHPVVSQARPLSLPDRASKMLDFYFSYTHCWLPIVERHQLLRTLYAYSDGPLDVLSKPSPDHAILWAILALSSHQYMRAVQIANPAAPPLNIDAESIYATARLFIPKERQGYEIGHVQALLLLALVDMGHGRLSATWALVGQAVRLAIDLDLGNNAEQQKGKSVFLACFILDTLISARLGRQPHLRSTDMIRAGQVDENGLDEWDPWKDYLGQPAPEQRPAFVLSTFNRVTQLFVVLNDVICDASGQMYENNQAQLNRLRNVVAPFRDLCMWLDMPATLSQKSILPHQMVFLMFYKAVELAIQTSSYPHLHAFENPERVAPEAFHRLSCDMLQLLAGYETHRFIFLLPPVSEYVFRSAFEAAVLGKLSFGRAPTGPSFTSWLGTFSRTITTLQACWPGFHFLQDALDKEVYMVDLMSPTLTHGSTRGTLRPGGTAPTSVPSVKFPFSPNGNTLPSNSLQPEPSNITSALSALTPMQISPSSPDITRSVGGSDILMPSIDPSLTMAPPTSITGGIAMPAESYENQPPSTYSTSLPMDMTNDLDAIFDDLAHLDTTDWATEREDAFKDFGFNDEMTFRAFCNDPERLNPSNSATPFMTQQFIPQQQQQQQQQQQPQSSSFLPASALTPVGSGPSVEANSARQRSTSRSYQSSGQMPSLPEGVGW